MSNSGCKPDAVTFSTLIAAYDKGGQWALALQVTPSCMWPQHALNLNSQLPAAESNLAAASMALLCKPSATDMYMVAALHALQPRGTMIAVLSPSSAASLLSLAPFAKSLGD